MSIKNQPESFDWLSGCVSFDKRLTPTHKKAGIGNPAYKRNIAAYT